MSNTEVFDSLNPAFRFNLTAVIRNKRAVCALLSLEAAVAHYEAVVGTKNPFPKDEYTLTLETDFWKITPKQMEIIWQRLSDRKFFILLHLREMAYRKTLWGSMCLSFFSIWSIR
jgi:hypothetical protein